MDRRYGGYGNIGQYKDDNKPISHRLRGLSGLTRGNNPQRIVLVFVAYLLGCMFPLFGHGPPVDRTPAEVLTTTVPEPLVPSEEQQRLMRMGLQFAGDPYFASPFQNGRTKSDMCNQGALRGGISDQCTIVVSQFYEQRLPVLREILGIYLKSEYVHEAIVMWNNMEVKPDPARVSTAKNVRHIQYSTGSLNNRFLPHKGIKTECVIVMDDDIWMPLEDFNSAIEAWMQNRNKMVGMFPRHHRYVVDNNRWVYEDSKTQYSMMLTKLMILDSSWLTLYSCHMPQAALDHIDANMNCEDIAMNFLISKHTGQPPLLVKGDPRDYGDNRNTDLSEEVSNVSLGQRAEHKQGRSDCVQLFSHIFGGMPLVSSSLIHTRNVQERVACKMYGAWQQCNKRPRLDEEWNNKNPGRVYTPPRQ